MARPVPRSSCGRPIPCHPPLSRTLPRRGDGSTGCAGSHRVSGEPRVQDWLDRWRRHNHVVGRQANTRTPRSPCQSTSEETCLCLARGRTSGAVYVPASPLGMSGPQTNEGLPPALSVARQDTRHASSRWTRKPPSACLILAEIAILGNSDRETRDGGWTTEAPAQQCAPAGDTLRSQVQIRSV
jgi:hypothetical protein